MSQKNLWLTIVLVLILTQVPYLYAAFSSGGEYVFSGFLLNPIDGNSYLAKMQQGYAGSWRFVLPYTAEPGEGASLFLFYLFLGHLARLSTLPLAVVFHLARAVGTVLLMLALNRFLALIFVERPAWHNRIFLLAAFGSGIGFLAALAGTLTADFWVAEAYPFLSAYANAHFPLGLALLLFILTIYCEPDKPGKPVLLFAAGLALAVILPFGVVVVILCLSIDLLWNWLARRPLQLISFAAAAIGGGLFLLYQELAVIADPVLSAWNQQNITLSPPLWDFLLSFLPVFALALAGFPALWRKREQTIFRLLLIWLVAGFVLIYLPFSLQRRFMLGYYIPAAACAGVWLSTLRRRGQQLRWLYPVVFGLSLITNLLVIVSGISAAGQQAASIYYRRDDAAAFAWIRSNTEQNAVILSPADIGNLIPAQTGRRVIYGHPFETVDADRRLAEVESYFFGRWPSAQQAQYLRENKVLYVYFRAEGQARPVDDGLARVYQNQGVSIYRVIERP